MLQVLSIKLRYKLYFSFSIPTPGFIHFYYMLGANLGLLLHGEVFVMKSVSVNIKDILERDIPLTGKKKSSLLIK